MPPRLYSRYTFATAATALDGSLELSDYEPYRYEALADTTAYVVNDGDTYFTIAGKHFAPLPRPAGLYWIICDFQPVPVVDPTIPPTPGTTLYLPSVRTVTEIVFNEARRAETAG